MSDVTFQEEQGLPQVAVLKPRGLAGKLVGWGVVKDELQANILLLIFAVLIAGAAAYVFMAGQPKPYVLTPQEQLEAKRMEAAGN